MEVDPLRLIETLRERRRTAGLTRTRLAALSGVDSALIARFERGDAQPSPAQARALRVALTGEDEPPLGTDDEADREGTRIAGAPDSAEEDAAPPGSGAVSPETPLRPPRPAPRPVGGLVASPPPRERLPHSSTASPLVTYDPDIRVYSTAPTRFPSADDRRLYLLRRIRTAVILLGMAIVLWWAVEAFQEAAGDVIELFRTPTTTLG